MAFVTNGFLLTGVSFIDLLGTVDLGRLKLIDSCRLATSSLSSIKSDLGRPFLNDRLN
ncbi:Uncharacterised protein [Chlamydia trachomatis]|nr:Uncharacterised protein [Chlamydia trachomatis]